MTFLHTAGKPAFRVHNLIFCLEVSRFNLFVKPPGKVFHSIAPATSMV